MAEHKAWGINDFPLKNLAHKSLVIDGDVVSPFLVGQDVLDDDVMDKFVAKLLERVLHWFGLAGLEQPVSDDESPLGAIFLARSQ